MINYQSRSARIDRIAHRLHQLKRFRTDASRLPLPPRTESITAAPNTPQTQSGNVAPA